MNAETAELHSAFLNVLNRLDRLPQPEKHRVPVGAVVGMALPLGVNASPPTQLMVFPLGEPASNDARKWRFTSEDLARVKADFDLRSEPLPIMYAHGDDASKGLKAAGWVDSLSVQPDGLYANVRWTEGARSEIRSGEWGFRSPSFEGEEDADGCLHPIALNEVSLVNDPAIAGMAPVTAASSAKAPTSTTNDPPRTEEKPMSTTVEAAKNKAAAALDKAGVLDAIKAAYPGCDVFGDDVLAELIGDVLDGSEEDAPGQPGAKPKMPGGGPTPPVDKPATVAPVPQFTSVTDAPKAEAATPPANDDVKAIKEENVALAARLKTLEGAMLSGKIITASAADRTVTSTTTPTPDAPNTSDHVGRSINAYKQDTVPAHQAAIAYKDKAENAGKHITYREAVVAVTRKTA